MHQLTGQQEITISGPFGDATLRDESAALHLISAGIGITPTLAKLQALVQQSYDKPIFVTHVARSRKELALWDEVISAADILRDIDLNLYLTSETEVGLINANSGRPDFQAIAKVIKSTNADVHICGQNHFVNTLLKSLAQLNVNAAQIFVDNFSSSNVETTLRPIPHSAPIKVTLARSNISDYWQPDDGTLLDFIESRGALVPSHCRAGICKTCRCNIVSGTAT
jgi:ferredoxin-NADP reductase